MAPCAAPPCCLPPLPPTAARRENMDLPLPCASTGAMTSGGASGGLGGSSPPTGRLPMELPCFIILSSIQIIVFNPPKHNVTWAQPPLILQPGSALAVTPPVAGPVPRWPLRGGGGRGTPLWGGGDRLQGAGCGAWRGGGRAGDQKEEATRGEEIRREEKEGKKLRHENK